MMTEQIKSGFFSKTRVETFSDGIFAIIITLLVLEIKVPQIENHHSSSELWSALWKLMPKVISWMMSFLIVCVIWVNHHRIFEQVKTVTHGLFWFNANLLLWTSFIPFPTALMGDYINNTASCITFGIILSLAAMAFSFIRMYNYKNSFILQEGVNLNFYKKTIRRSLIFGPAFYLIGAMCSLIHTYLSLGIYFFIPIYFIFFNTKSKS